MITQTYIPRFPLNRFVDYFFFYEGYNPSHSVERFLPDGNQVSFTKMSQEIGYSQKHFISMFKNAVGVTPKAYLKIARFQKAINEIEQQRTVSWTTISQDCGFYDQSHFINDFRLFSGFTPEQYLRRKNETLNYVPVG